MVDFVAGTHSAGPSEKAPMTDDQLAKALHELKRRRETPLPLIEMFDELLSVAPGLSAEQKRRRSDEIMAAALKRLERKDAGERQFSQRPTSAISPPCASATA
jgi:hypothetical protein